MGNVKFNCQEKSFKSCQEPKKEVEIFNEKRQVQFKALICTTCMGVISYEKVAIEEPKKASTRKKAEDKSQAAIDTQPTEPLKEEVLVAEVPAATQKEEPKTEAPKAAPAVSAEDAIEKVVIEMEDKQLPVVDIIIELKTKFGMSNAQAAKYLTERKAKKAEAEEAVKEEAPAPAPAAAQADVPWDNEPVKEEVAETIPAPLSAEHAEQREASPIKPKIREIPEVTKDFPINFFELLPETKSYRFKLHNEDGVEFQFEITPAPQKYENVAANPGVFEGKSLVFTYSKVDEADIPVEPVLTGVK